MYPQCDEPTVTVAAASRAPSQDETTERIRLDWLGVRRSRRWRVATTGVAAAALIAAGVGGGKLAVDYVAATPIPDAAPSNAPIPHAKPAPAPLPSAAAGDTPEPGEEPGDASISGTAPSSAPAVPPSQEANANQRAAWGLQYGQRLGVLSDLPNVAAATPAQQAAATNLLTQTQVATAGYAAADAAQAAGYDFAGALARQKAKPAFSLRLARVDSGVTPAKPVVLRVPNKANQRDGSVLDPGAPDALVYTYQGHNKWKLAGATFRASGSYPNPPPDPGGPITRWHYVATDPALLTMDVYFVSVGDLAHAYALTPPNH